MKLKVKTKIKEEKITERGKFLAILLSISLVVCFSVMQGLEIKSATDDTEEVTLSVTVAQTITLDVDDNAVSLGTLTPGEPVSNSNTCTVTTNAESGYDLAVKRDDTDTTMDKIGEASTNITDKTAWNSTTPNSAEYSGTGLAFRVSASTATKNSDTWWGSDTSCPHAVSGNAWYAGFPTAYENIMDHDSYSATSTTTTVCYRLDVPSTQKSGSYDGTITYQATSKP